MVHNVKYLFSPSIMFGGCSVFIKYRFYFNKVSCLGVGKWYIKVSVYFHQVSCLEIILCASSSVFSLSVHQVPCGKLI